MTEIQESHSIFSHALTHPFYKYMFKTISEVLESNPKTQGFTLKSGVDSCKFFNFDKNLCLSFVVSKWMNRIRIEIKVFKRWYFMWYYGENGALTYDIATFDEEELNTLMEENGFRDEMIPRWVEEICIHLL